jgi:hypothetical protein
MSNRYIPDRYLNTTIDIIRDDAILDNIGDAVTTRKLIYGSVKANVQSIGSPNLIRRHITYEIQGKVWVVTHRSYFNRFKDGVQRKVVPGDYVIDFGTMNNYLVLSVLEYQDAKSKIRNSHHIVLMMTTVDGSDFSFQSSTAITGKGKIV